MDRERRRFLKLSAAGTAIASLGDVSFARQLPQVAGDDARVDPSIVQFRPEIEPLVRLLEETPRGALLERVAERIRGGVTYREILAALLLAGVRNVEPRPSVGFKFHAVLVVNSCHLASLSSPVEHRWLPIFWALDHFKSSQARDEQERGWTMAPVADATLPAPSKARETFIAAMDDWDESASDAAIAQMARTLGGNDVFELLFRYGARDFRSIGHKAIFVANSWRTLQCIGWQHAEPVLRSLTYALLNREGAGANPAKADLAADRPWRQNLARVSRIRPDWLDGRTDDAAVRELLAALREADPDSIGALVVELLNRGIAPQSIWDGMLLGGGELLARQPGIVSLHALTTSNAMRFLFQASGNDETRRMILLQNAAFLTMFRQEMHSRGQVGELELDQLEPAGHDDADELVPRIFAELKQAPRASAEHVMAYLQAGGDPKRLIDTARMLVFLKGNDSHDYKFSSAVLEDFEHLSPSWRHRFLAASVFRLRSSAERDIGLVERTRAALG